MIRLRTAVPPTLIAALALAACASQEGGQSAGVADSGSVAVDGAHLNYVIEGRGPTALVIGSSVYYPRVFSQELRKRLKLVFVDLRHFAAADPGFDAASVTIDTYADDVEWVRTELELGTVIVIGHSIHGNLALEYARRYPESVSNVVVIGSPPVGLTAMGEFAQGYWENEASEERKAILASNWERMGDAISQMSPEEALPAAYVANGPRYWADSTYDASWLWEGMPINAPISDRIFGELFSEYDLASGDPIETPVLVIMGIHDYVVPYQLWDDQLEKLPDVTYYLFTESGHTPQLEEPGRFDRLLLEWLQRK